MNRPSVGVVLAMICILSAGCGRRSESPSADGAAAERQNRAKPDRQFDLGIIFDVGGRGDKSCNDSAFAGLEAAKRELGVACEIVEPASAAERESGLRTLARKDLDLIIAIGFEFTDDITRVAREFPDRRFACVNYSVPAGGEADMPFNLRALLFREEEGCFLVGALAGWSTRTGRIGFVGRMDDPVTHRLEKSFTAGVRYANPRAEVGPKYVDAAGGKETALALYDAGADIILQAAGSSGLGVFEAAKERKRFVIGLEADQWDLAPDLVLTSIVKHVDRAVLESTRAAMEGNFRGGITRMGLLSGGIELVFDDRNTEIVSSELRSRVESVRRGILGKQIVVPTGEERKRGAAPGR